MAGENVLHYTASDVTAEALLDEGTILVDFWAPWCGPCRMVGPVLDQLADEYQGRAKIAKVNIDENAAAAERYGVSSIPTMILFKGGREVERVVGAQPRPALKQLLDRNL